MIRSSLLFALLLLFVTVVLSSAAAAQSDEALDYKADFIVKLPKYVTWPDGAGTNANGEVVVHLVGESPLADKIAAAGASADPKVVVKTFAPEDDFVTGAQIVFTTTEETSELAKFMKKVQGKPILTVSDAYYFAKYGIMVNFVTKEDDGKQKVKFEVNRHTLDDAGLKMSSQLLKLAIIE